MAKLPWAWPYNPWPPLARDIRQGVQAVQLFSVSTCILVSGPVLRSSLNSRLGRLPKKTVKKTPFLAPQQGPLQTVVGCSPRVGTEPLPQGESRTHHLLVQKLPSLSIRLLPMSAEPTVQTALNMGARVYVKPPGHFCLERDEL